jgi:hypothetical protein
LGGCRAVELVEAVWVSAEVEVDVEIDADIVVAALDDDGAGTGVGCSIFSGPDRRIVSEFVHPNWTRRVRAERELKEAHLRILPS